MPAGCNRHPGGPSAGVLAEGDPRRPAGTVGRRDQLSGGDPGLVGRAPCWTSVTRTPPELPGLMAALVWMTSGSATPSSSLTVRPRALMIPSVTLDWSPSGLPMARVTWKPLASSTTWSLVTMSPLASKTMPEPSPSLVWMRTTDGPTCLTTRTYCCRRASADGETSSPAVVVVVEPAGSAWQPARTSAAATAATAGRARRPPRRFLNMVHRSFPSCGKGRARTCRVSSWPAANSAAGWPETGAGGYRGRPAGR